MKITDIRLGMLRVPLRTPFKTALRTVERVEDVVVAIHTDTGHVGHGEAAATAVITGDTHGAIVAAIAQVIAPRLVGQEVGDLNRLVRLVQTALVRNTSAKAAVEIALYDLFAQLHGAPLYRILGGGTPVLTTDITISVGDVDAMVADARSALERGFGALKIKVGQDIALDFDRVRAIHAAVDGRASLRLDANQGWTPKQAVQAMRRLENAGIHPELLEQPVPAHDLHGLKFVTDRIAAPVMADESVFGPVELIELIRLRAADIVNIKLMKTGGLSNAIRLADIAAVHGMDCMIGCMLESSISVAAAVHLAAARSDAITRIDLDGPSLCAYDPVEGGARFDGPTITIGDAPGLGIVSIRDVEPIPA
ncbi:dipeptide epimerase [Luteimonas sp. FCS-9]|uniref:dipeptide epimerase n=1 Tax=Luteimonas sp. FCS-9 TaxID=1547516 RepID=UPI00063EA47D|nr:dipeptide epimerase [Luteimonas sp. FCS-9]KLJ01330.1 L-alanine-DL-glutamate epimerase [Luteimonas sp. FCS-9]